MRLGALVVVLGFVCSTAHADPPPVTDVVAHARYMHDEWMEVRKAGGGMTPPTCERVADFESKAATKFPPFAAEWKKLADQARVKMRANLLGDVSDALQASQRFTPLYLTSVPLHVSKQTLQDLLARLLAAMAPLNVPGCFAEDPTDTPLKERMALVQARVAEMEAALKTERDCRSSQECLDKRWLTTMIGQLCRYIPDRAAAVADLAKEKANPSGVVDLVKLHDLGQFIQDADAIIVPDKAAYASKMHKPFTMAACP